MPWDTFLNITIPPLGLRVGWCYLLNSTTRVAIDTQGSYPNKPPDPTRIFDPDLVKRAQGQEEGIREIILALTDKEITRLDPRLLDRYTIDQECLYFMKQVSNEQDHPRLRFVVPNSLMTAALQVSHDSALGGHYGESKTLYRARELFFWPNLAGDIKRCVASCRRVKREIIKGPNPQSFNHCPLSRDHWSVWEWTWLAPWRRPWRKTVIFWPLYAISPGLCRAMRCQIKKVWRLRKHSLVMRVATASLNK